MTCALQEYVLQCKGSSITTLHWCAFHWQHLCKCTSLKRKLCCQSNRLLWLPLPVEGWRRLIWYISSVCQPYLYWSQDPRSRSGSSLDQLTTTACMLLAATQRPRPHLTGAWSRQCISTSGRPTTRQCASASMWREERPGLPCHDRDVDTIWQCNHQRHVSTRLSIHWKAKEGAWGRRRLYVQFDIWSSRGWHTGWWL